MAPPADALLRQDPEDRTPVTVVVSRFVTSGHETDYRDWVFRVLQAAEQYPNNLGAVILSPGARQPNVYQLVHRFADEASLRAWESSETRQKLSREADAFSTSSRQQATGMETWFSLPEAPGLPPPAKWKMAVASFFATYSLTSIVIPLEWLAIPHWPFPISNIVTNVLLAVLMTFVVMPTISSFLRDWLYSGSSG
ncbi:antibiotic biosynthesis monooxygenase [Mesorhizobium sp. B2-4-6]|uniref:antibiotic biosynthesis monooxygenase n=1 Tax=Mesorhizobium sp. B2-4-6 TaxID=2589943 RepID=UPI00112EBFDA|nr:antibiotic biosynthesis monooxygenase [Mesorhizobium sp. B2-4-6]TPL36007.1 hypothetical protein FJ957_29850 [Mesorhizobium sp. B2-4-6]